MRILRTWRTGLTDQVALAEKAFWVNQLAIDSACSHSGQLVGRHWMKDEVQNPCRETEGPVKVSPACLC